MQGYDNRGTWAWSDPGAANRPRTEIVRSMLINSAARSPNLPDRTISSTPGEYIYEFEKPQRNVTTLQLGSFVLGEDPRIAYDEQHVNFQVSQGVQLDVETSVTVEVDTTHFSLTEGGYYAVASQSTAQALILAPKTNIPGTLTTWSDPNATFTLDGEIFAEEWGFNTPPGTAAAQIRANIKRIAEDPADGDLGPPAAVVDDFITITGGNVVKFGEEYEDAANVDASVAADFSQWGYWEGLGVAAERFRLAWFSNPRLTIDELAATIDRRLSAVSSSLGGAQLRSTFSTITGEVAVWLQSPAIQSLSDNTVNQVTAVRLTNSVQGDVTWQLGIDNLQLNQFDRPTTRYPNAARTIQLPVSSLSSGQELVDLLNRQANPLYFSSTLTEDERTLWFKDVSGSISSITYLSGQYNLDLFAEHTTDLFQTAGSGFLSAEVDNGSIVFVSTGATTFEILFDRSPELAKILHYDPRAYFGSRTTAEGDNLLTGWLSNPVATGYATVSSVTRMARPMFFSLSSADESKIDVFTGGLIDNEYAGVFLTNVAYVGGGADPYTGITANVVYVDDTDATLSLAHGLVEGTRVFARNVVNTPLTSLTTTLSTPVYGVVQSGAQANDPSAIEINFGSGLVHMFLNTSTNELIPDPASEEPLVFGLDERDTFLFHGQRPPLSNTLPAGDYSGAIVRSARDFGPAGELLGARNVVHKATSFFTLPSPFMLSPPSIVLVELVSPTDRSVVHDYDAAMDRPPSYTPGMALGRSNNGTSKILAVLIITNGFARITEEMTHVNSLGPADVGRVHLRFLNPDMTVVDWQGKEHFLTLLTKQTMGRSQTNPVY